MEKSFYSEIQNTSENIELLKASSVAYNKAKINEFRLSIVFCVMGILYPITYLLLKDDNFKHILFVVSLSLTFLYQLLIDNFKGNTSTGALLKEEFDINIFGLPRKFMLPELEPVDVGRLADQYKGSEIRDWYSNNILDSIPRNTIIAICQRVNCKWDLDLRNKYSTILLYFIITHFAIVLIAIIIFSYEFLTPFLLCFSLSSFYTHFISIIRGNLIALKRRRRIITKLDSYINYKKEFTIENLRDVQDEILIVRQEPSKVPDLYFKKYNSKFKADHEKYIERINKLYKV